MLVGFGLIQNFVTYVFSYELDYSQLKTQAPRTMSYGDWMPQSLQCAAFLFQRSTWGMIPASWNILTWPSTQMLCSVEQDTVWRERLKLQFDMGPMPDIKGRKWHPWWFVASERWITNGNSWKTQEEMSCERYFERTALWHQLSTVILYSS